MTAPDTPTQHPDDRDKHSTTEDRARRDGEREDGTPRFVKTLDGAA